MTVSRLVQMALALLIFNVDVPNVELCRPGGGGRAVPVTHPALDAAESGWH